MTRENSRQGTRRRARGTGSIFPDKSRGVWIGRVPIGTKPNGRTMYREVSHKTQGKCAELMRLIAPPTPDVTVKEFAAQWLETLRVRPQTRDGYASSLRSRIVPVLGHLRVASVTSLQVEAAARQWEKTYKTSTVLLTLTHLRILFRAAIRVDLIARSPVSSAAKPRSVRVTHKTYTPDELAAIVRTALLRPGGGIVAALASTGMRKGEAIALDVSDFDRQAGTVRIDKTLTRDGRIGPPKSVHSIRTIRVPSSALPAFITAAGARRSGPLFQCAGRTKPGRWSPVGVDYIWQRIIARLALPLRNPHQLRHSVATAMISAGEAIGDVAAYLGDTPDTVVRTYLHPTGADPSRAMDRLFAPKKVQKRPV